MKNRRSLAIRISSSWLAKKSTERPNKLVKTKLKKKRENIVMIVIKRLMKTQRKSSRSLMFTKLICSELRVYQP